MIDKDSRDFITSLARGLDVLACFDESKKALTISDVASRLGISRPTARRVLLTLESVGYLAEDGRGYALTPRILTLCQAYLASHKVTDHIQPILEKASKRVGETAALSIRDGDEIVIISRHTSPHMQNLMIEIGTRMPLHVTAMGRAILSMLSEAEQDDYLSRATLRPYTSATVTNRMQLRQILQESRERGYVVVDGELQTGTVSIAAPILYANGTVYGAVNFGGDGERMKRGGIEDVYLPELKTAAHDIGMLLI